MSKSKKRLIVRLFIVIVILSLGVFAIVQAQRGALSAKSDPQTQTSMLQVPSTTPITPISATTDPDSNGYNPSQPSPTAFNASSYDPENQASPASSTYKPPSSYSANTTSSPDEQASEFPTQQIAQTTQPNTLPQNPFGAETPIITNTDYSPPADKLGTASISDIPAQSGSPSGSIVSVSGQGSYGGTTDAAQNLAPIQAASQRTTITSNYQTGTSNFQAGQTESYLPDNANSQPNSTTLSPAVVEVSSRVSSQIPTAQSSQPGLLSNSSSVNDYRSPSSRTASNGRAQGKGKPGQSTLEGTQTPSLALEKRAPAEIQVGKPATFEIIVKNVGQAEATEVVVIDQIPQGTQFIDSQPPAEQAADGTLIWRLGAINPGDGVTISIQLLPVSEGEIGSVAKVLFQAQASVRTVCTRPQLTVRHTAPPKVLIGQDIRLSIEIANPGSGDATGVILEEDVPSQLSHPAGNELEFEIGVLRPGESRKLELTLKANKAGVFVNTILVRGEGNLISEDRINLEVIAPQLKIDVSGPSRRYLNRQATYHISVANPGTATANDVELVAYLPKGMKYLQSNNNGQYDTQNHAVSWSLQELPPSVAGNVELIAVPIETGQQKLRIEGRADLGLTDVHEKNISVEALAELFFEVADTSDPIEVGSDTVYTVRIVNQGSKTATNIRLVAEMPQAIQPTGGEGPTRATINGQTVFFEPLARLAPNSEVTYKLQARGLSIGDHRIRVQVSSDEAPTPVAKEESTRVYADD